MVAFDPEEKKESETLMKGFLLGDGIFDLKE
jgi:hypothetical protein